MYACLLYLIRLVRVSDMCLCMCMCSTCTHTCVCMCARVQKRVCARACVSVCVCTSRPHRDCSCACVWYHRWWAAQYATIRVSVATKCHCGELQGAKESTQGKDFCALSQVTYAHTHTHTHARTQRSSALFDTCAWVCTQHVCMYVCVCRQL